MFGSEIEMPPPALRQISLLLLEIFHLHNGSMAMAFIHFIIIFTLTQVHSSKKNNQCTIVLSKIKNICWQKETVLPYRRLPKPPGELI